MTYSVALTSIKPVFAWGMALRLYYHLPTAVDMQPVEAGHVETPSPLNPLGSKGAGESGIIPAQAAMVNAIEETLAHLGVRFYEFPLGLGRLWELIEAQRQDVSR